MHLQQLQSLQKLHLDLVESDTSSSSAPIDLDDLAHDVFADIIPQLCILVVGYGVPPYQEWVRGFESFDYVSTDEDEWKRSKWWEVLKVGGLRSQLFY